MCPHSLGTLIEWKPYLYGQLPEAIRGPHSLGTLIEWKRNVLIPALSQSIWSPLAGDIN